jgi:two-component system osmolarity sensor histidine kinase EnvZ
VTPDVTVRGNPTMLQRTLMNLLDNAARHGAPPVSLSLAVDKSRNEATLVVQDHGPGVVDPKRMLQPFERGDESRAHGGAGLGLAIVARIVERHGGTLDIGAVETGGTRVEVRFPLAKRAH